MNSMLFASQAKALIFIINGINFGLWSKNLTKLTVQELY